MIKRGLKSFQRNFKNQKQYFSKISKEDLSSLSGKRNTKTEEPTIYNINSNNRTQGYATEKGTLNYSKRNPKIPKSNFKSPKLKSDETLTLSTLGYGTYIGDPIYEHDVLVKDAILKSVETGGINVIDTAINYRYMKAERTVGVAIKELEIDYGIQREELFICSKGGYIAVNKTIFNLYF